MQIILSELLPDGNCLFENYNPVLGWIPSMWCFINGFKSYTVIFHKKIIEIGSFDQQLSMIIKTKE